MIPWPPLLPTKVTVAAVSCHLFYSWTNKVQLSIVAHCCIIEQCVVSHWGGSPYQDFLFGINLFDFCRPAFSHSFLIVIRHRHFNQHRCRQNQTYHHLFLQWTMIVMFIKKFLKKSTFMLVLKTFLTWCSWNGWVTSALCQFDAVKPTWNHLWEIILIFISVLFLGSQPRRSSQVSRLANQNCENTKKLPWSNINV